MRLQSVLCLILLKQVAEGFIVDEEEEPEERARRKREKKKRRRAEREEEEGLDIDDLELIGAEVNDDRIASDQVSSLLCPFPPLLANTRPSPSSSV